MFGKVMSNGDDVWQERNLKQKRKRRKGKSKNSNIVIGGKKRKNTKEQNGICSNIKARLDEPLPSKRKIFYDGTDIIKKIIKISSKNADYLRTRRNSES